MIEVNRWNFTPQKFLTELRLPADKNSCRQLLTFFADSWPDLHLLQLLSISDTLTDTLLTFNTLFPYIESFVTLTLEKIPNFSVSQ